jgi:hypothetical protein
VETIRLAELADENSMIVGKEFANLEILGPAIIVPLDSFVFDACAFDGTFDTTFHAIEPGTRLNGVIGLRQVTFQGCRFQRVGVWAIPAVIHQFGQDFLRGEQ